jgi:GGDEF domain-containing protein
MAIERAHRHGNWFALVYLDADQLQADQRHWGHAAGDAVLTAIAERLTALARQRHGGPPGGDGSR